MLKVPYASPAEAVADQGNVSDELRVQRGLTEYFISTDPEYVELVPRVRTRTPAGGWSNGDGAVKERQLCKLIMVSPAGSSIEQITEDGTERRVEYQLLCKWNADVEIGDHWEKDGGYYEVLSLVPYNGYEVRAVVQASKRGSLRGG